MIKHRAAIHTSGQGQTPPGRPPFGDPASKGTPFFSNLAASFRALTARSIAANIVGLTTHISPVNCVWAALGAVACPGGWREIIPAGVEGTWSPLPRLCAHIMASDLSKTPSHLDTQAGLFAHLLQCITPSGQITSARALSMNPARARAPSTGQTRARIPPAPERGKAICEHRFRAPTILILNVKRWIRHIQLLCMQAPEVYPSSTRRTAEVSPTLEWSPITIMRV